MPGGRWTVVKYYAVLVGASELWCSRGLTNSAARVRVRRELIRATSTRTRDKHPNYCPNVITPKSPLA
jgi:hypothetical protein